MVGPNFHDTFVDTHRRGHRARGVHADTKTGTDHDDPIIPGGHRERLPGRLMRHVKLHLAG
jgi:hypothetical protein